MIVSQIFSTMPAKRRSSKFIKQAPNPNAPAIVDVDADLSLLSGNAEKLGTDLIKISKSGNFQKISKLLAHVDAPQFINQKDKVRYLFHHAHLETCIMFIIMFLVF